MRTFDYQQRIAECARQAECAPNPLARIQWKRMEGSADITEIALAKRIR